MYADVLWYVNQRVICHPIQAVLVRSDMVDQHRSGAGNANITPKVTRDTMCVVHFFQERLPFQTMLVLIEEISPLFKRSLTSHVSWPCSCGIGVLSRFQIDSALSATDDTNTDDPLPPVNSPNRNLSKMSDVTK